MREVLRVLEKATLLRQVLKEPIDAHAKKLIMIHTKEILNDIIDRLKHFPSLGIDEDDAHVLIAQEHVGADVLQSALEFGEVGCNLATLEISGGG